MESIWNQTANSTPREALSGDVQTEAAVIGGGLAGVLTAFFLQRMGIKTILLEANRLGSGQTGNTTAKITAQHNLIYAKLIKNFGLEKAKEYAGFHQRAVEQYRELVSSQCIDCDFTDCPAYLYTTGDPTALQEEAKAANQVGLPYEFVTQTCLPFAVTGAVRLNQQARFHPLSFLYHVAKHLTVYENTRVTKIEGDHTLVTPGGRVTAQAIVFACHFPFVNFPGFYFMRMYQERSYVIALKGAQQLDGVYLDVSPGGLSLRNQHDLLFVGGSNHRTGENSGGGRYDGLLDRARELYPEAEEVARWSAQDCMTLDGVPYIGKFAPSKPNWYVATGFGKWGMSSSMVAALIVSDLIAGRGMEKAEVFSPSRFGVPAAALAEQTGQTVKGIAIKPLTPAKDTAAALLPGHGGVVEYAGEKVGAYKDESGRVYWVDVRCPHMGCQLEWNPDEKSWDCPCHGSRFDFQGRLLDNPAQEGIAHE